MARRKKTKTPRPGVLGEPVQAAEAGPVAPEASVEASVDAPVDSSVDAPAGGRSVRLRRSLLLAAGLVLLVFAIYGRTIGFGYVSYDDNLYVYENEQVQAGLSAENVRWAFVTLHAANWHPVTWLSLMLDATLFGGGPGARHLVNVGLHAANAVLFFLLLLELGAALWPAVLAAALFAAHPCHVESVAWITERKDVLSTLFLLLSISGYVGWVKRGGRLRYLASLSCMALGLLAKPMLVTLPFALLILDVWPLRRLAAAPAGLRLVLEKIPFLALALASVAVTILAQHKGQAVVPLGHFPLPLRLANALTSYAAYLGRLVLPAGLAVWYPYPASVPVWSWAGALALLVGLSAAAYWQRREQPYLLVGWLWFMGTLVPVIGILQVGGQAMADRYAYVPYLGLYAALALGLERLAGRLPQRRGIVAAAAGVAVAVLGIAAFCQAGFWKDNTALYERALAVTRDNHLAHVNLGNELRRQLRFAEALEHFREAARIKPDSAEAWINASGVHLQFERFTEAEQAARTALALEPESAEAEAALGIALLAAGWPFSAEEHLQRAIERNPGLFVARRHLEEVEAKKRAFRSFGPRLRFELLSEPEPEPDRQPARMPKK
jgi:tetratricopeptide (TPR) repeat protein